MKKTISIIFMAFACVATVMAEDYISGHAEDVARVFCMNDDGETAKFAYQTGYSIDYTIEDNGDIKRAKKNGWKDGLLFGLGVSEDPVYGHETATITYYDKELEMYVDYDYSEGNRRTTIETESYYSTGTEEWWSIEQSYYEEEYKKGATFGAWIYVILTGIFGEH